MAIYGDEREYIPILQMMETHKNRKWTSSATDITDLVDRTVLKIGGKLFVKSRPRLEYLEYFKVLLKNV